MSADIQATPSTIPANDFWKRKTIKELVAEQGIKPYDPSSWQGVDITDEEMEWWLTELRRLRREGGQAGAGT